MDSGFNMLGQFQGDSSLGFGAIQAISVDLKNFVRPVGWFAGWNDKTPAEKKQCENHLLEMYEF